MIIRQSATFLHDQKGQTTMTTTTGLTPNFPLPAGDDRGIYGDYPPTQID